MQRETFPQFKVNELDDFPLPKGGEKHRDEITKLAGKILAAKKRDPMADTTALERELARQSHPFRLAADGPSARGSAAGL